MKLSQRLRWIADAIPFHAVVADVGCDHGKLAVFLLLRGNPRVFAVDISRSSLEKAVRLAQNYDVDAKLYPRVSDGLRNWQDLLPNVVVIAGLSGKTIANILQDSREIVSQCDQILVQPMQGVPFLRKWLAEKDWPVVQEALIQEEGRYFFIFRIVPGSNGHIQQKEDYTLSDYLLAQNDPVYYQWLVDRREGDRRERARLIHRGGDGLQQALAVIDARRETEGKHIALLEKGAMESGKSGGCL